METMSGGTEQFLFEIIAVVISAIFSALLYYGVKFVKTNEFLKKYAGEIGDMEEVLKNAVGYARKKALEKTGEKIDELDLAVKYVEEVSPETYKKYGFKLKKMAERKIFQEFGSEPKKDSKEEW